MLILSKIVHLFFGLFARFGGRNEDIVSPPPVPTIWNNMECGKSPYEPPTLLEQQSAAGGFQIINGHPITNATFLPWMATISSAVYDPPFHIPFECAATVIGPRHVLTAGLCLFVYYHDQGYGWKNWPTVSTNVFTLTMGAVNRSDPNAIRIRSAKLIPNPKMEIRRVRHPFRNSSIPAMLASFNDIGLIELESPLNFTDAVHPICLSGHDEFEPQKGVPCTIAGWGQTIKVPDPSRKSVPEILRAGQVLVFNQTHCTNYTKFDAKTQLCAVGINGMATSCVLDGGTPLLKEMENGRWKQIGINGFPITLDYCGSPDVSTRISPYCGWIFEVTNGMVKCV